MTRPGEKSITSESFSDFIRSPLRQLNFIPCQQEWGEQIDTLNEDLLQVEYPGAVLLDLGWYPACSRDGQFQVRVIRNCNWEAPIFYAEVTKMKVLRSVVEAARQTAREAALIAA